MIAGTAQGSNVISRWQISLERGADLAKEKVKQLFAPCRIRPEGGQSGDDVLNDHIDVRRGKFRNCL